MVCLIGRRAASKNATPSAVQKRRGSVCVPSTKPKVKRSLHLSMPADLTDRGQALENEYFRKREEEIIAKMKAKIEDDDAKRLGLKCPKCDGTLIEADYEDIKIDVCDKCTGVW